MKKVYLFSAIAMALLTACQENEALVTITDAEINSAESVELSASINESSTRTYLGEGGGVCWEQKEAIGVFYLNSAQSKFTVRAITNDAKTNASLFCASPNKSGEAIAHAVAVYPYDANATLTLNYVDVDDDDNVDAQDGDNVDEQEPTLASYTVATTFPAVQSYKANSFGSGASPMMAIAEKGSDLGFKNVAATIKLQLTGTATISKVEVTTTSGKPLAGACTYTMPVDGGAPTFAFNNGGDTYTTITLDCGEEGVQLKENEATNFMFTLPPMHMDDNELLFHVYNKEDGVYTEIKKETGWNYERSKITAVGPYTYEMPVYAASINGKPYDNVADAFAAFAAFETGNITEATMNLKKDIVLGTASTAANSLSRTASTDESDLTEYLEQEAIIIPTGKTLTLNLNGHSIHGEKACTESFAMIDNNGTLIITGNGTINFKDTSAGDPSFGWGSYTILNKGTLIVENGTIEHLGEQAFATHMICAIFQYSGSTTINGGTISTPNYRSARLWMGDMTINGGNFEGQLWVQAVDNTAELTINGGTFAPRGRDGSSVFITNDQRTVGLTVTGGYFNTKIGSSNTTNFTSGSGMVTGGTFTESAKTNTKAELLATGYQFVANGDGTYSVKR